MQQLFFILVRFSLEARIVSSLPNNARKELHDDTIAQTS
jgi:hypothetical protein